MLSVLEVHGIAQGAAPRLVLAEEFEPVKSVVGTVCKEIMRMEREQWLELGTCKAATDELRRIATRLQSCEAGASDWLECIPS